MNAHRVAGNLDRQERFLGAQVVQLQVTSSTFSSFSVSILFVLTVSLRRPKGRLREERLSRNLAGIGEEG